MSYTTEGLRERHKESLCCLIMIKEALRGIRIQLKTKSQQDECSPSTQITVYRRQLCEDGVDGQHDAVPDGPPSQLSVATYRHVTNSNPGNQGATDTDFSLSNLP